MQEAQQRSLTKEQKEAVGILSIGTFFEQFDIMLYIHMAVLLNELFFPQTDQNVASLLSAFTFCSTFIFIPIGALIFGWVGDNIGRKSTVVLTTLLTALSCLTIAFLPTYAEIGKPPIRYYAVALIPVLGYSGGLAALGVASLIVYAEVNWRGIFVFGALIALVGIAIRTKLSETKDFANASKRLQTQYNVNPDEEDLFYDASYKKTSFAMFCTQCAWPLCFYFVFIYCSQMLKSQFEYSVLDIIKHNFVISIFPVVSCFIRAKLSKKLHPLILFKYSLIISFFFFIITAFYLDNNPNPLGIGIFQSLLLMFTPNGYSESSVMFPHFPVFKRFQSACLSYAFSRAFMYIATSFGLIFIIKLIGISGGLIFAASCVAAIGTYGYFYFLRLEQKNIMI